MRDIVTLSPLAILEPRISSRERRSAMPRDNYIITSDDEFHATFYLSGRLRNYGFKFRDSVLSIQAEGEIARSAVDRRMALILRTLKCLARSNLRRSPPSKSTEHCLEEDLFRIQLRYPSIVGWHRSAMPFCQSGSSSQSGFGSVCGERQYEPTMPENSFSD